MAQNKGKTNKGKSTASSGTTKNVSKEAAPTPTQDQTKTEDQTMSDQTTNPDTTPDTDENAENAPQTDEQAQQAAQDAEDAAKAAEVAQALRDEDAENEKKDTDFDAPELSDDGAKAAEVQSSRFQAEPNGKIIDVGDEVTFDGEKIGNQIVVKEDVYRRFYPRSAKRASYELLFRKGSVVSATQVEVANRQTQGGPGIV